jgi:hypothetical protein
LNDALLWIESTGFSTWMRESPSVLAFPAVLALHAIGMAMAAGVNAALGLRLLGVSPAIPVGEMRRFVPVMWAGFWLNAASGVALLLAYPTKALTNPVFYIKLSLIAAALALFTMIRRRLSGPPAAESPIAGRVRVLAVASLTCWAGAILSGRLLAYTYGRLLADW